MSEHLPVSAGEGLPEPTVLPDAASDSPAEPDLDRIEEDLLAQTAEVVQQVQSQMADLARREESFRTQLGQLDQERRAFRLEQQHFETDTARTRESLESRRSELAIESDQLRQERAELGAERESAAAEFRRLQADRARYRQELQAELHNDRTELQQTIARADELQAGLAKREEALQIERREFDASLDSARALLDEELAGRRAEFDEQLKADRGQMEAEVNEQLKADRGQMEAEVNEAAMTEELKADRHQLEQERERFQQTITDWERRQEQDIADQRRRQETLDEEQRRSEREIDELRRRIWDEIDTERTEHQNRLRAELQRATQEWEQSQAESHRKMALEQSRLRFQQDHLQRTREEVETAQNQLRVEYQKSRQRLEDMLDIQRLRDRQLDRRRAMYEHIEQSLARRQDTVVKLHQSVESHSGRERERLSAERESWELKLQSQSAENRRQTDILALHAENLEKRRMRLDTLRTEIESRHSELLETQLAVEEAWAQLSQITGDDAVQARVDETRSQLSIFYTSLRQGLTSQQTDLDEARDQLTQQRQEFHLERQQLTEAFADQEQQLRRRAESLRVQLGQVEQQEAEWQRARDAWIRERLEAEEIIRELLAELADAPEQLEQNPLPADLMSLPGLLGLSNLHGDAA
jgi:chromosome segregation ATPase